MFATVGLGVSGCSSSSSGPDVVPTVGRVLLNGKPAAKAIVTFHPKASAAVKGNPVRPVGNADADGQFKLTTTDQDDGAPAGDYAVTVSVFKVTPSPNGGDSTVTDIVPPQYRSSETTPLRATVKPGGTEPIVLDVVTNPKRR